MTPARLADPVLADPAVAGPCDEVPLEIVTDGERPRARLVWPTDLLPLQGHYPGFPIVPGVFLVDTAQRAARALLGLDGARWTAITSTRFLRPVFPGDAIEVEVTSPVVTDPTASRLVRCDVTAGGEPVAAVRLRFGPGAPPVGGSPAADDTGTDDAAPLEPAGDRDVAQILPHRWPMLLVDRVVAVGPVSLVAQKAVSVQDWVFRDGATTRAYPWALVVESWCQAAGVLAAWHRPNPDVLTGDVMLFGGIADIELGDAPHAGDVLTHHVRLERDLGDVVMMSGSTTIGDRTALTVGRITMAMRPAHVLRPPASQTSTDDGGHS